MPTPAPPAAEHELFTSDAVTDAELGHDILFGLVVGTPLTYFVVFLMCLAAGIGLGNSLGVAALPCALSGVFFGGIFPLSRQMARHERAETAHRLARPPAVPPVPVVAPLAVTPAV